METYMNRIGAFDKDQTYTLDDRRISNGQTHWNLEDIRDVHLSFKPTKHYSNIYQCAIVSDKGKIVLSNRRYIGPANFDYQSAEYSQFVRSLLQQLGDYGLTNFKSGKSKATYWLEVIASILFFSLILVAIAFFGAWYIALGFFTLLLFRLVPYYKKNRPMIFSSDQIPNHILP
ncbi:hypothetical protein ACV07N_00275 [Roseivirga echinicomitans]